ncbi:2'-5' RNA ligase superfamily protein [Georgenia satyanarayanai]|uniref:2'-5' RNA ligase superfamily protein n=1 Tax=Georgenia satyanarayanai TaxID=860221 RepID=A0A2Y9AHY2_9MICO|nr:2'-5' RNA ligase family protein [Georgenia satyanarayanai]PYF99102.1 2'-5' RNA ligase superfamily protein [Georgenia satyanarayanai]SSA44064.1 2'-5' RNA ligase superfamily protein [Georgenia satyanarayanai]
MALAVCLLLDPADERALVGLWRRVEDAGVPSMATHTHGRHLPHLSYAVLHGYDVDAVRDAVAGLPDGGPLTLHLTAVATAPRGRAWLVPAASAELVRRQRAVVEAVTATGAELHRHYVPGRWLPHVSLTPRARLVDLPVVADVAYAVLPLAVHATRAALIDSATGERWPLGTLP